MDVKTLQAYKSPDAALAAREFVAQAGRAAAFQLEACVHCGQCADACHFYQVKREAKYTPVYKLRPMLKAYQRQAAPVLAQLVALPFERCRGACEPQAPREPVERLRAVENFALPDARDTSGESRDAMQPVTGVRHDEFGRARGRRCPDIGDEVRDREIDLVADCADDRDRAIGYGASERLVVEGPEVLE